LWFMLVFYGNPTLMSWPGPLLIEDGPAIHCAACQMDGAHTLSLWAKPGHDK